MKIEYKVENNKYLNIKQLLKEYYLMSDRLILKLKNSKQIYLNGKSVYVTAALNLNDIVYIDLEFEEDNSNIVPIKMDLNIIYEDDYYIVIDKPAGIPVHPSASHYDNTLSNGLKYYFDTISLHKKIRPVNRLDKDTSGIVIFAKSEYIQECLIKQMKSGDFKKEYIAILDGILDENIGKIDAPISRKSDSIIEREISSLGDNAITHFEVISHFSNFTLVSFKLETGRTHQIRVHSKYISHPILGDTLYGKPSELIDRQALHACRVEFIHPILKEPVSYTSSLPKDIQKILNIYNFKI